MVARPYKPWSVFIVMAKPMSTIEVIINRYIIDCCKKLLIYQLCISTDEYILYTFKSDFIPTF